MYALIYCITRRNTFSKTLQIWNTQVLRMGQMSRDAVGHGVNLNSQTALEPTTIRFVCLIPFSLSIQFVLCRSNHFCLHATRLLLSPTL